MPRWVRFQNFNAIDAITCAVGCHDSVTRQAQDVSFWLLGVQSAGSLRFLTHPGGRPPLSVTKYK